MRVLKSEAESAPTLSELCVARLRPLCAATGLSSRSLEIEALAGRLMAPWGDTLTSLSPSWPSIVGDDGTPFEFSLSVGAVPELRMLVEPLASAPALESNRDAALALLASLSRDFELDHDRLELVQDLFLPARPFGSFAICLAVGFSALRPPQFKLYLNPEAHGKQLASALVEEALVRLGLDSCWPAVARGMMQRGPDLDELKYFSFDLSRSAQARVKVYVRHQRCTPEDLERTASAASFYRPGEVTNFVATMTPDCQGAFQRRSPLTCYAFVRRSERTLITASTHLPVNSYAPDDETIERRVLSSLAQLGLEQGTYSRSLRAYANRSLHDSIGVQSYVSLVAGPEARLTVYLAAEAYQAGTVADPSTQWRSLGLRDLIERFERRDRITNHPFLRRLRREPVNLGHLWLLLANFQISISKNFARWLAGIVARVEDDRVRCILADQLNDELGRGAFESAHVNLFAQMMEILAPFGRPRELDAKGLVPGQNLEPRLARIYGAPDPFEAVGAVLAGEIFGKQMDQFLGEEFRRQTQVDSQSLAWLMLHETLEVAHADASGALADLVPPHAVQAASRGAMEVFLAGSAFLDELYAGCYGKA